MTYANIALSLIATSSLLAGVAFAQEGEEAPKIKLGDGAANSISMDGLRRIDGGTMRAVVSVEGANPSTSRASSSSLVFSEVVIEKNGWLVLHPLSNGKPNGRVVSGFAYLTAGKNANVTIPIDHPAKSGDMFLVMLHSDVDEDQVFDFVFVDGVNVEDRAVFEGDTMIAHIFSTP